MRAFRSYVEQLETLLGQAVRRSGEDGLPERVDAALDGEPSAALRRLIGIEEQRAAGAFFTGSSLAGKALSAAIGSLSPRSVILDPACGAGDLLVTVAKHLPTGRGLRSTLKDWGRQLIGRDLHGEFVRACQTRLALAAVQRGLAMKTGPLPVPETLFPRITTGDGMSDYEAMAEATHIVINPPFTRMSAPHGCAWGSGSVSTAALFMDVCTRHASVGTRIVAILPDVLRSGERYRKWRSCIEKRVRGERIHLRGQFDRWADVDVFILECKVAGPKGKRGVSWQYPEKAAASVADYFDVSVGPVVPFRDEEKGKQYRYIHPRILPAWGVSARAREHRRFTGTVHEPPFVVIRRTSRYGDKHRAVGTIIEGRGPVAVENHLLVLRPKDRTLETCRRLLDVLRSEHTDEWLNERIRCRHLTAGSVEQLPWREGKG